MQGLILVALSAVWTAPVVVYVMNGVDTWFSVAFFCASLFAGVMSIGVTLASLGERVGK